MTVFFILLLLPLATKPLVLENIALELTAVPSYTTTATQQTTGFSVSYTYGIVNFTPL